MIHFLFDNVDISFQTGEDFYDIASDSNASPDDSSLGDSLLESTDFEMAVMNRLDMISISVIISACILFLLLLRFRKG